jgi:hypothetical protein
LQPKIWASFLFFKELPKVNNRPKWRNFAQSGHPGMQAKPKAFSAGKRLSSNN